MIWFELQGHRTLSNDRHIEPPPRHDVSVSLCLCQGIIWTSWKGKDHSIQFTEMKMRPADFRPPPKKWSRGKWWTAKHTLRQQCVHVHTELCFYMRRVFWVFSICIKSVIVYFVQINSLLLNVEFLLFSGQLWFTSSKKSFAWTFLSGIFFFFFLKYRIFSCFFIFLISVSQTKCQTWMWQTSFCFSSAAPPFSTMRYHTVVLQQPGKWGFQVWVWTCWIFLTKVFPLCVALCCFSYQLSVFYVSFYVWGL